MNYADCLEDLVEAMEGHPVGVILLMCSNPKAISAGFLRLQMAFPGPVGGYPNLGYNPTGPIVDPPMLTNQTVSSGVPIFCKTPNTPPRGWPSSNGTRSGWEPKLSAVAAPRDPSTSVRCGSWSRGPVVGTGTISHHQFDPIGPGQDQPGSLRLDEAGHLARVAG